MFNGEIYTTVCNLICCVISTFIKLDFIKFIRIILWFIFALKILFNFGRITIFLS